MPLYPCYLLKICFGPKSITEKATDPPEFITKKATDPHEFITKKATAILLEFYRGVIIALRLSTRMELGGAATQQLKEVKSKVVGELGKERNKPTLLGLLGVYQEQGRFEVAGILTPEDWMPLATNTGKSRQGNVAHLSPTSSGES